MCRSIERAGSQIIFYDSETDYSAAERGGMAGRRRWSFGNWRVAGDGLLVERGGGRGENRNGWIGCWKRLTRKRSGRRFGRTCVRWPLIDAQQGQSQGHMKKKWAEFG